MKVIRASKLGPSWALAMVVIVVSLCRESFSMEGAIRPVTESALSDTPVLEGAIKPATQSALSDTPVLEAPLTKDSSTFKAPTEGSTSALLKEDSKVPIREKSQPKRLDDPGAMEIDKPIVPPPGQMIFNIRDHAIKKLQNTPAQKAANAVLLQALHGAKDPDTIAQVVARDFEAMMQLAGVFGEQLKARKHVMIIDNEPDDLFLLLIMATKGILPRNIVTFGGHPYLRAHCANQYVSELAKTFSLGETKIPKVHMGLPYLGRGSAKYELAEGTGYVEEGLRQDLIKRSIALKHELQASDTAPWLHSEFLSGMQMMRDILDNPNSPNNAFILTTAPTMIVHLLDERPERALRMILTMSSPYYQRINLRKAEVSWEEAYNAKGSVSLPDMNKLLEYQVRMFGVGGGVSMAQGMRQISDAAYGTQGSHIIADHGLVGLEQIIRMDSPIGFASILAKVCDNLTKGKVDQWTAELAELNTYRQFGLPKGEVAKLAKANSEFVEYTRGLVARYKNPVQIDAVVADVYAIGLAPDESSKMLQGAVSYSFKETPRPIGADGTPSERPSLAKFHPSDSLTHFAVTDFNAFAMRDTVQQALDHVGKLTQVFTPEDKAQELERIARLKESSSASI